MAIKDLIFLKQRRVLSSLKTYIYGTYEDTSNSSGVLATPDGGILVVTVAGFLEKWSSAGVLAWRSQVQGVTLGSGYESSGTPAAQVALDGSIYISGNITPDGDCFLAKLSSTGAPVWSKTLVTSAFTAVAKPTSLSIDPVTGRIAVGIVDYEGRLGQNTEQQGMAVLSFNAAGVLQWAKQPQNGGAVGDSSLVAYAPDGSLRVTGVRGPNNLFPHMHVSKMAATGATVDWTRAVDYTSVSCSTSKVYALGVDAAGNSYITGSYTTADCATDPVTILKVSPTGAILWQKRCRLTAISGFLSDSMHVTASGDIYLGSYASVIKLDTLGATAWGRSWLANAFAVSAGGLAIVDDTLHYSADVTDIGAAVLTMPTSGLPQPTTATLTTPTDPGLPMSRTFTSVAVTNANVSGSSSLAGSSTTSNLPLAVADYTLTTVNDPGTAYTYQA